MSIRNSNPGMFSVLLSRPHFSFMDEVTTFIRELCDFSVPEGFEDDAGFHVASGRTCSSAPADGQNWLGEHI